MDLEKLLANVVAKLESWGEAAVDMLPEFALAILTLLIFGLAARLVGRAISAVILRVSANRPISDVIGSVARVAVWAIGIFIALGFLKLDKTVTTLLAGVGVVGLALGFAFQDIAANFMSGFIIALRRPFDVGDFVETAGISGTVERVELRATILHTLEGLSVIIPNKDVFQNPIINYNKTKTRRAEMEVGVAYDSDLEKVRLIVLDALDSVPHREEGMDALVFYQGFGDSSINLKALFWLESSGAREYATAVSESIIAVKKAFDQNGIVIPFPIRTLDFGAEVVGGRPFAPPTQQANEA